MIDHEIRGRGVGGSEVAAILGLDSRRDAYSVYVEKVGLLERKDRSGDPRMARGHRFEQSIVKWYGELTGQRTVWWDRSIAHPSRQWQVMSPDAFALKPDCTYTEPEGFTIDTMRSMAARGIDAKTCAWDQRVNWGEPDGENDSEAVPIYNALQAVWYMSGLDLPAWDIACAFDMDTLKIYTIPRDMALEDTVLEQVERFWTRNVVARVPPIPGHTPATTEALSRIYPRHRADVRYATPEEAELLLQLRLAREDFERAKKQRDGIENRIKAAIGEHEGINTLDGGGITWRKEKDTRGTDWEGVARELDARCMLLKRTAQPVTEPWWTQMLDELAAENEIVTRHGARKLRLRSKPGHAHVDA